MSNTSHHDGAGEPIRKEGGAAITCDIAVIGGGVVGCAVARALTLQGARVILLEKAPDILAGASKGNSALLHTGFDAPTGTLELRAMQSGYAEYLRIRERLNLPLLETGGVVVAWSDDDVDRLDGIERQARDNGVNDVARLTRSQLLQREPGLSPRAREGILVPGEHVIDAWSAPLAYLTQAVANGARVRFNAEVLGGSFDGSRWTLSTPEEQVDAGWVVNCAGLYGDIVERRLLGDAHFVIRPRKGQFVVFDKTASRHLRSIILPTPSPTTKGVVVTRTIYGNVLVGPTAEDQGDRDRAAVDHDALTGLMSKAASIVPALADEPVTATYAGLRPATDDKAYQVRHDRDRHWLTLGGIRSTGLTAALGLGAYAAQLLELDAAVVSEPGDAVWTPVPNLSEHLPRDWSRPGGGEIVCHCELVTRREIDAAFASPVPPGDFGGLKRRTRAAMGRCQGFYCGARLAQLTRGRLASPLAVGDVA